MRAPAVCEGALTCANAAVGRDLGLRCYAKAPTRLFAIARGRVFGLGPEAAVLLKPIRSQLRVRYEWDMGVRSRPQGSIFAVGFNYQASRH